jgi:predicted ArsR family transcriptional regulator
MIRKRDDKLAALVRDPPAATIGEMARQLRVAKNTVRAGLERLEIAGVIEREGRSWRPAEPRPAPETPRWTGSVSARRHPVEERAHA